VVKWHRKGFRIYWRWRSRCPGGPKTSDEVRDLIRRMSLANPLRGAPRIHDELLKVGIEVRGNRGEVSASALQITLPDLTRLSAEPCGSHRGGRHVCDRDRDI
jgi:hypothetical protein